MACPFSAFYASKGNAGGTDSRDLEATEASHSSEGDSKDRKISLTKPDFRFQHQGSFSTSGGPKEEQLPARYNRTDAPKRIVWERGPSLEYLRGPNGVGMVQQRVNTFTQQISDSGPHLTTMGINRSASSSAVSSKLYGADRSRTPKSSDDQPLVRDPVKPIDPSEPLTLKNLTEAVWNFVTLPVSKFSFPV